MDGLFPKALHLRFNAPAGDVERFIDEVGAELAEVIGDADGEVLFVTFERFDALMEDAFTQGDGLLSYEKRRALSVRLHWWDPTTIKRGRFYSRDDEHLPTGVRVYYDAETGTVYFYWHWS